HVVEYHLVEMVFARHQHDWFDRYPLGIPRHQELAETGVAVFGVHGAGACEHHDLMRVMRAAGPYLRPVEDPATIGARCPALDSGKVRPGAVFTHAYGRVEPTRGDARQEALPLLLCAVGQQRGGHLAIRDPMSG